MSRCRSSYHHESHGDALRDALDRIPHAGQGSGCPVPPASKVLHRVAVDHLRVVMVAPVLPAAYLVMAAEDELHHL